MENIKNKMKSVEKWMLLGISLIGLTIMECLMFDLCGFSLKVQEKIERKKKGIL